MRAVVCAVIVATLGGCARYHEQPLTKASVEKALTPPDDQAIRLAAQKIQHPILPPIDLNLDDGVSPDEAAVLAVLVNPALRAERDRRAIAEAQLLQAGLLPNPTLNAGVDFPVGGPDNSTAYSFGIDWEVTSLIGRKERRHAAAAEAQSVELDIAWKEWQTAEEAKTAAFDVISLMGQLTQLREIERQLNENRDLLRRAVDQHQKTLSDLAASEAAAEDGHQAVVAAEGDLRRATVALNRAIGLPPDKALRVQITDLPSQMAPPSMDLLMMDLEERRLDLVALQRGYESQDATLRAAILAQFPRITVGPRAGRDTSEVSSVGLGATIDLPIFDRNQGVIATETATRQKLFDEYVSRVVEARSDVATAIAMIESLNRQIAAAEAALTPLENLVRTYQEAERRGDVDVLSLYSSQNTLLQKRIDLGKLKQQLIQNWVALEIAAGQYLPPASRSAAAATQPSTTPGATTR